MITKSILWCTLHRTRSLSIIRVYVGKINTIAILHALLISRVCGGPAEVVRPAVAPSPPSEHRSCRVNIGYGDTKYHIHHFAYIAYFPPICIIQTKEL